MVLDGKKFKKIPNLADSACANAAVILEFSDELAHIFLWSSDKMLFDNDIKTGN